MAPRKNTAPAAPAAKGGARASGTLPTTTLKFSAATVEIPKRTINVKREKMVNPFAAGVAQLVSTFESKPERALSVPCDEANAKYWTGLVQRAAREAGYSAYVVFNNGTLSFRLQTLVKRERKAK